MEALICMSNEVLRFVHSRLKVGTYDSGSRVSVT